MKERIKRGLESFQRHTYKEFETLYQELETQQHPHTLFIGCSDSRVSPERLLNAAPGDIFVLRNIANSVPSIHADVYDTTTLSGIEYAVLVLNVKTIIVCGHSNCGGCAAALSGKQGLSELPYTQHYLQPLEGLCEEVETCAADEPYKEKAKLMEELNVLEQLKHLKEYDFINERIADGRLELEGWRYDIGSGKVERYDNTDEQFQLIIASEKNRKVQ